MVWKKQLNSQKIMEIEHLRAMGYSYCQIRDQVGVSKSTAYTYGSGVPVKKANVKSRIGRAGGEMPVMDRRVSTDS